MYFYYHKQKHINTPHHIEIKSRSLQRKAGLPAVTRTISSLPPDDNFNLSAKLTAHTVSGGSVPSGSSLDFSHNSSLVYYSQYTSSAASGKKIMRYNYSGQSLIMVMNKYGPVRRSNNDRVYVAQPQSTALDFIQETGSETYSTGIQSIGSAFPLAGLSVRPHRLYRNSAVPEEGSFTRYIDQKQYELKDHLGNVRAVVSDRKAATAASGTITNAAEVLSYNNYYAFGMIMPGRSYSPTGYRYGFGNQEKDDEISGVGNSYSFTYRIYNSRLGRFLSVDPIAKEYPWNSTYAFAENSPIAFIDLEGLERYFAADGSYLGKLGTSNKMRVVAQTDVKTFANFKSSNHGNTNPPVFDASKQFHNAGADAQAKISRTIYSGVINKGGSLNRASVNPANDGTGMSMTLGGSDLTIYPNLTNKGEHVLDDYYNFSNLLFHEDQHRKGVPGDGWSHFAIAKAQTKHWSFNKMSEAGQDFIQGTMRGYLNEDMENWMNQQIFFAGSKENATKIFNSDEFQNAYKRYTEDVNYYNETFGEDYQKVNYEKMMNDVYSND